MPRQLFSINQTKQNLGQPSEFQGVAVTPSDGTDLADGVTSGVVVTGAGNVNVQLQGGGTAVLTGLIAGQFVRLSATRILATSTTATGIFALYPAGNL